MSGRFQKTLRSYEGEGNEARVRQYLWKDGESTKAIYRCFRAKLKVYVMLTCAYYGEVR